MSGTSAGLVAAFEIAALRRRFLARVIDYLAVYALGLGLNGIFWGDVSPESPELTGASPIGEVINLGLSIVLTGALFVFYEGLFTGSARWNGQTPGKRLSGVRISTPAGTEVTRATAWRRAGLMVLLVVAPALVSLALDVALATTPTLSELVVFYVPLVLLPLVVLTSLRGGQRATPYDRWASTVVVTARRRAGVAPAVGVGAPMVFSQPAVAATGVGVRARTGGTWWLAAIALAGCAAYAVAI